MKRNSWRTILLLLAWLFVLSGPVQAQGEETCEPPDPGEPNETAGSGPTLIVGQSRGDLLLTPLADVDFFRLWAKGGEIYRVTTHTHQGVDTRLQLFDEAGRLLAENDDYTNDHPASRLVLQAEMDGWLNVRVDSSVPLDWGCRRYGITVDELSPTPTPTGTATPSPTATGTARILTATPTRTPLPDRLAPDAYEPNNEIGQAKTTGPGLPLNLNFNPDPPDSPLPDIDFFRFSVKTGDHLSLETINPAPGLDTALVLYGQDGQEVAANDDCDGARRSCIEWRPGYDGLAFVQVSYVGLLPDPVTAGARAYNLVIRDLNRVTPSPEPTRPPQPTAPPVSPTPVPAEIMPDQYEPNWDFERATVIGPGQAINANFNPWPPGRAATDNDFYRLAVKAGDRLRVETRHLASGVDTNLILYRDNRQLINGNDDCVAGERRSCLDWTADYNGPLYILVGPVGAVPHPTTADARAYSLLVTNLDRTTPTPEPTSTVPYGQPDGGQDDGGQDVPWPVTPPVSPGATNSPTPSATPTTVVRVRSFSVAPPTPTPRPLQSITVEVNVYYDSNNNQGADGDEGVAGLNVLLLDGPSRRTLGQAFTDRYGHAVLTVAAMDDVRLSLPYLGHNQAIRPPGETVVIRLAALQLPSLIP